MDRAEANRMRFVPAASAGHYESWFQRANHPSKRLAFWIRYTIFRPGGRAADAVGELWAMYFDGERGRIAAAKQVHPISDCRFAPTGLDVAIGDATLDGSALRGAARSPSHGLEWQLEYDSPEPPLLLLPHALYERGLPKAKALVGSPNAVFRGRMIIDGESVSVDGWTGSQNHNWGTRHTDSYAWGQVAGFDGRPDACLECSTAQLRIGPIWTPRMSLVVLRLDGEEHRIHTIAEAVRARSAVRFFDWTIDTANRDARVSIHIAAEPAAFAALTYPNPPGGAKTCLNSKLASCELVLERRGRRAVTLRTRDRAAFEILTDRSDHGVTIMV